MKKVFSCLTIILIAIVSSIAIFGCDDRYGKLTMSADFTYKESVVLDNGDTRCKTEEGSVFDKRRDGSYIFYMDSDKGVSAKLDVTFANVPEAFKYDVSFSQDSIISSGRMIYIENGVRCNITAHEEGTSTLKIQSYEGEKEVDVIITVVKVPSKISFNFDNLAISNKQGSSCNLEESIILGLEGSFQNNISNTLNIQNNVKFEFGDIQADEFVPFDDQGAGLRANNFVFNNGKLTLVDKTSLKTLAIRAIYKNPLDEETNIIAVSQIRIISNLDEFEMYFGVNKSDAIAKNKIDENTVYEFVMNIKELNLNYRNIILKVKSSGEKVTFSSKEENKSPFQDKNNQLKDIGREYEYYNEAGEQVASYKEAMYTYAFYQIAPRDITDKNFYQDGVFDLKLKCDYSDYSISGEALFSNIKIKCFNLIVNFSVNKEKIPSFSYIEKLFDKNINKYKNNIGEIDIYTNTSLDAEGTDISIDVEPNVIEKENAKFCLTFFNFAMVELVPQDYFVIEANGADISEGVTGSTSFDKGTTFNIKLKSETPEPVNVGDSFYILVYAKEPQDSKIGKSACFIKLNVLEGITEIDSLDYNYTYYQRDENGDYVLDEEGHKIPINDDNKTGVKFKAEENGIKKSNLTANLIKGENNAEVTLNYTLQTSPLTGIKNLKIISKDTTVARVYRDTAEYSNKFSIEPRNAGSTQIEIWTTNSNIKYVIDVNVYTPINTSKVSLIQKTVKQGVRIYEENQNGEDFTVRANVEALKVFDFIIETIPFRTSQYFVKYTLKDFEKKELGSYSTKTQDTNFILEDSGYFRLDCVRNSFIFVSDNAVDKTYYIDIEIINYNNIPVKIQTIKLNCFVPAISIEMEKSNDYIYDPTTIFVGDKIKDKSKLEFSSEVVDGLTKVNINDKTVFGISIAVNKNSNRLPTFNFDNNGIISLFVNGTKDCEFLVRKGKLIKVGTSSLDKYPFEGNLLRAISDEPLYGYYWFQLKDNYSDFNDGKILIISKLIDNDVNLLETSSNVFVYKANKVYEYQTETNSRQEIKQGTQITGNPLTKIDINVLGKQVVGQSEKVPHNNKFFTYIYDLININGENHYVLTEGVYKQSLMENYSNFNLTIEILDAAYYGEAALVILPKDRINTEEELNKLNYSVYTNVIISDNDFKKGVFYTYDNGVYLIAEKYLDTETYYIKEINPSYISSLTDISLRFTIIVSDGDKKAYGISSFQELMEIGKNEELCTKKYVLTKDIDCSGDYVTIGNYFKTNVTENTFIKNLFYIKLPSGTYQLAETFSPENANDYYAFGFNGELSGLDIIFDENDDSGKATQRIYSIKNISLQQHITSSKVSQNKTAGLFSLLGPNGKIDNLNVEYVHYQPKVEDDVTFGGVVGINFGVIENVSISYNDYLVSTAYSFNFGGIVGKNYGIIKTTNYANTTGLNGTIQIDYKRSAGGDAGEKVRDAFVGGLVAINYGIIESKTIEDKDTLYIFNDIGFNSSLKININYVNNKSQFTTGGIGGAVGFNKGRIRGLSLQGVVNAPAFNNVGGLIGRTEYNQRFNSIDSLDNKTTEYSIIDSFSTSTVLGYENVGGLIGYAIGEEEGYIKLKNVSAENYASENDLERTFVSGKKIVGGLIGYAKWIDLSYSFSASYSDCMSVPEDSKDETFNYDIVGDDQVGGLIASIDSVNINCCSSYVNVISKGNSASVFIAKLKLINTNISNVYSVGSVSFSGGQGYFIPTNCTNSYTIVYHVKSGETKYFLNGNSSTIEAIKKAEFPKEWAKDENLNNNGLPYLLSDNKDNPKPLFVILTETALNITVNDNDIASPYQTYIKNDNNSLIFFYGKDKANKYSLREMEKINTVKFIDIFSVFNMENGNKAARFNLFSTKSSVLEVSGNGFIRINGVGRAKLIIASKLNSKFRQEIEVIVINGISEITLYGDSQGKEELSHNTQIDLLKSEKHSLSFKTAYERTIEEDSYSKKLSFVSSRDVNFRFFVTKENAFNFLKSKNCKKDAEGNYLVDADGNYIPVDGVLTKLDDIIKIGDNYWAAEENYYYVDVYSLDGVIKPIEAVDDLLIVSYIPMMTQFSSKTPIFLNSFGEKTFQISISNGAREIVFENNIDTHIVINQLENVEVTVKIITDYEDDKIVCNFDEIELQDYGFKFNLSMSVGPLEEQWVEGKLFSKTQTFTFHYKDMMNEIKDIEDYAIKFWAYSGAGANNSKELVISVKSQSLNEIYSTVYSSFEDFPKKPCVTTNSIYSGIDKALIALEVYPYFAKYSHIRISYKTNSKHSLFISQQSYNLNGSGGLFTDYIDSGAYIDGDGKLCLLKSSAQDTYLFNNGGKYSYSKSYFLAVMVPSNAPDKTMFDVLVEVVNDEGKIILTQNIPLQTRSKTKMNITFEKGLLSDDTYYLPINTTNEIFVTSEDSGVIDWEFSCDNYQFISREISVLTPFMKNGKYYMRVLDYENRIFNTNLIGKTISLTGILNKGTSSETSATVKFIITMFTVKDITVKDIDRNQLILANSMINPLKVKVVPYYDERVTTNSDNWYSKWYSEHKADESDSLYKMIKAAGYEIEEYFFNYFIKLEEKTTQIKYSPKDNIRKSGVWWYINDEGTAQALAEGIKYNVGTFGVEYFNDRISVFGYESGRNSTMQLATMISYTAVETQEGVKVSGIPNVLNAYFQPESFDKTFKFSHKFNMIFSNTLGMYNHFPISTPDEFMNMKPGEHYRLVDDIELSNYVPNNADFASLDGNNHTIFITSFGYGLNKEDACELGLFKTVAKDTILENITVYYTNDVIENSLGVKSGGTGIMLASYLKAESVVFGGIAYRNEGMITNCTVKGSVEIQCSSESGENVPTKKSLEGGLVGINELTGYITNSRVTNFFMTGQGKMGGFICENSGKIVSCYFTKGSLKNVSKQINLGGFVYSNSGEIRECFIEGESSGLSGSENIMSIGRGLAAKGDIGAFVYENSGLIADAYSNIRISSSRYVAGFVYKDSANSVIERCYSISQKGRGDSNITAFPFAGPISEFKPRVEVQGILNNCYFLSGKDVSGQEQIWINTDFYVPNSENSSETPNNKRAFELKAHNFGNQSDFVNYNIALDFNEGYYISSQDGEEGKYSYKDGYTWVIKGGKPVLVSTLVDTISAKEYQDKAKEYSSEFSYYNSDGLTIGEDTTESTGVIFKEFYKKEYDEEKKTDENLLYTATIEKVVEGEEGQEQKFTETTKYLFKEKGSQKSLDVRIIRVSTDDKTYVIDKATAVYGDNEQKILDIIIIGKSATSGENVILYKDNNFRANDTIEIRLNGVAIKNITYKFLEKAVYYYSQSISGVSDVEGTRTNPEIIYDYTSFSKKLTNIENTGESKFYRFIRDVDLDYQFVTTSHSTFRGVIQGNYMKVNNVSLSYYKGSVDTYLNKRAFGLFAEITTSLEQESDTVISNLSLTIEQVVSNAHNYVGGLAGMIYTPKTATNHKILLNNIDILSVPSTTGRIQGVNATGGLAGFATGRVVLRDITCGVKVKTVDSHYNQTKENYELLYVSDALNHEDIFGTGEVTEEDKDLFNIVNHISYAGGVVGIFDVSSVEDSATKKNYNATNILIDKTLSYEGNIVGTVFGLVGQETVVNYINVLVDLSNDSYVKGNAYAGGLVGENRGLILSSSVEYIDEKNANITDGYSPYSDHKYFFDRVGTETVAIGGLVGINNRGKIKNCKSSINVRNKVVPIAGGAVGRMVQGELKNISVMGAVLAEKIVGGLIGTINDMDILEKDGYYNQLAIYDYVPGKRELVTPQEDENTPFVTISGCVAANNWLAMDYKSIRDLQQANSCSIGGFIGLVTYYSQNLKISNEINYRIKYDLPSYYSNLVHHNSGGQPLYLDATYYSYILDGIETKEMAPVVLSNFAKNSGEWLRGEQRVFPYKASELLFNSQDNLVSYTITEYKIEPSMHDDENPYINRYYKINSSDEQILNSDDFYIKIIDKNQWRDDYNSNKDVMYWAQDLALRKYEWYKNRFGIIYYKDQNNYIAITDEQDFANHKAIDIDAGVYRDFYYIGNKYLKNYSTYKTYNSNVNKIELYIKESDFKQEGNPSIGAPSYTTLGLFKSITDIDKQKTLYVNGIEYRVELSELVRKQSGETYIYTLESLNLKQPDSSVVDGIEITIAKKEVNREILYKVDSVKLHFTYTNISSDKFYDLKEPVTVVSNIISLSDTSYAINISPKKIAYQSFDNGYWYFPNEFLDRSFSKVRYQPRNIEKSEIYIWDDFIDGVKLAGNPLRIETAQQLAKFASEVNNGNTEVAGKTVELTKDIDLSGKYWVPIGTPENPFTGKFDGKGHSIKYISVNEHSIKSSDDSFAPIEYAGLFGYVQGSETNKAIICNLSILSGEVKGKYAGGIVAYAKNAELYGLVNKANSTGFNCSGGLVGEGDLVEIYDSYNYGVIKGEDNTTSGGIVGKMTGGSLGKEIETPQSIYNIYNSGSIYVKNDLTYYSNDNYRYEVVYAGGFVGLGKNVSMVSGNENTGSITVKTNAHKVYAGGIMGYLDCDKLLKDIKNSGEVIVYYQNICADDFVVAPNITFDGDWDNSAGCNVGGLFGYYNSSLSTSNSIGKVDFITTSAQNAKVNLGGLVGRQAIGNKKFTYYDQCYNASNVTSSTISESILIEVGGIVGAVDWKNDKNTELQVFMVQNSYNTGYITCDNSGQIYVAGIVGRCVNGLELHQQQLHIQNCINIGNVTINNMVREMTNILSAIVSTNENLSFNRYKSGNLTGDESLDKCYNFYLRDSAYSGGYIATAYTKSVSSKFEAQPDNEAFAVAKISSSLKDKNSTFLIEKGKTEVDNKYCYDFINVWVQEYDTWYPTLRKNTSLSFWEDKTEELIVSNNTYLIENEKQLAYVAKKINSGEIQTEGVTFKLTRFIDLANRYWTPIGNDGSPFKGTFDGNGYVIRNMTIDSEVMRQKKYGGLFGYVKGATIKNIAIEAPFVMGTAYASGIVCRAEDSSISKVYTEMGDSKTSSIKAELVGGGIVGELIDSNSQTSITQNAGLNLSYNNVPILADIRKQNVKVGGLVGVMRNSHINNAYNGDKANITFVSEGSSEGGDKNKNVGAMVVGSVDDRCRIINVFNIASKVFDQFSSSTGTECSPILYNIVEGMVKQTTNKPTYDKLVSLEDENMYVEDLWIKDYSFNPDKYKNVPSIRGLGKEWKNKDNDTLVHFEVTDRKPITQIMKTVKEKVEDMQYVDKVIPRTTLNFAKQYITDLNVKKIYLISSENELVWLANNVNSGNIMTDGCEFILLKDLDLSSAYWTPIGLSKNKSFQGIFNFNNHIISGITIDGENKNYTGLFGYTSGAYILNGYIENSFIKITNNDVKFEAFVGSLAGYAKNTTIMNMSLSGITSVYSKFDVNVGGAVGYVNNDRGGVDSKELSGIIQNVRVSERENKFVDLGRFTTNIVEMSNGPIFANSIDIAAFSDSGKVFVGGIVGFMVGNETKNNGERYLIKSCINESNIAGLSFSNTANVYVGGLLGYGSDRISVGYSSSNGMVKSYSSRFDFVGGLLGYARLSTIKHCLFDGYVEARQNKGRKEESLLPNDKNQTQLLGANDDQKIWSYVGGIAAMVEDCYISNNVIGTGYTVTENANPEASTGAIIGCAMNQNIVGDGICVYPVAEGGGNSANGFSQPIGWANHVYDPELLKQKYLTKYTDINPEGEFDEEVWKTDGSTVTLRTVSTQVMKSGETSISITNESTGKDSTLDIPQSIYDLNSILLKFTNLSGKYELCVGAAVRDAQTHKLKYVYFTTGLEITTATQNLVDYFGGLDISESVLCLVEVREIVQETNP